MSGQPSPVGGSRCSFTIPQPEISTSGQLQTLQWNALGSFSSPPLHLLTLHAPPHYLYCSSSTPSPSRHLLTPHLHLLTPAAPLPCSSCSFSLLLLLLITCSLLLFTSCSSSSPPHSCSSSSPPYSCPSSLLLRSCSPPHSFSSPPPVLPPALSPPLHPQSELLLSPHPTEPLN